MNNSEIREIDQNGLHDWDATCETGHLKSRKPNWTGTAADCVPAAVPKIVMLVVVAAA
ncbi:hypothetical protein [Pelagimonas varians]|uniref:hypothetical protein n=1 Tax=Pelagimonas varians TaxID=696760 RepID=UPI0014763C46|nr:hypothetical protein [Pelagimonas varians]